MVFSSLPPYLDSSNWHQTQNHSIIGSGAAGVGGGGSPNPRFAQTPPPPPPPGPHGGSVRPGSMSERARMANIPMPETALKCPRCESTNTKFCYFNNYSLTQPRHFCKTCRRYWTRGGALRNVPVGGGCRRNKRSKSSTRSKSPASADGRQTNSSSTPPLSATAAGGISGGGSLLPFPPLRYSSQLSENFAGDLGLNYGSIGGATMGMNETGFQLGGNNNLIDPWRLQQFPILSGTDPSSGLGIYQFHQGGELGFIDSDMAAVRPKLSSSLLSQLAAVKMEENPERQMVGSGMAVTATPLTDHHWNGNSWNEVSGFSPSSTTSNQLHLQQ